MIGAVGSSFCPENTQMELAWAGPCVGLPLPVISPANAGAEIAVLATTIAVTISNFLMKAPLLIAAKVRQPNSTKVRPDGDRVQMVWRSYGDEPAGFSSQLAGLLANPLAKSFPATAPVLLHPGRAALARPSGVARLARAQRLGEGGYVDRSTSAPQED